MKRPVFIVLLLTVLKASAQENTNLESVQAKFRKEYEASRRAMDSILFPERLPNTLEGKLAAMFPAKYSEGARWACFNYGSGITKLSKPFVEALIPDYNIYKIALTNVTNWHFKTDTCLVVFDSTKSNLLFVEPVQYGNISKPLLSLFTGKKFDSEDSMLNFFSELKELLVLGSWYQMKQTSRSDSLLTFDLGYPPVTIHGSEDHFFSSVIPNSKDVVWRKIAVEIEELRLIRFAIINPMTGEKEIVE